MRLIRPCFWYLAVLLPLGLAGYLSWRFVPEMMEVFKPRHGLLPGGVLIIKTIAPLPVFVAALVGFLFIGSSFLPELHSMIAIKLVSLGLIVVLLFGLSFLFVNFALGVGSWQ